MYDHTGSRDMVHDNRQTARRIFFSFEDILTIYGALPQYILYDLVSSLIGRREFQISTTFFSWICKFFEVESYKNKVARIEFPFFFLLYISIQKSTNGKCACSTDPYGKNTFSLIFVTVKFYFYSVHCLFFAMFPCFQD